MEMKKLKKLVSILLAAVLVFGVAATGFAAAPENVVLEEVAADAAAAPEEAPVVDEAPVAEVTAVEEETVADVAAAQTITFTANTESASGGGGTFYPIPNASVKFTYTGAGDSIAVTSGTQTGTLTSTNPVTISLGEAATAGISFDVTNGSGIVGGTLTAELVDRSSETTGLIYDSGDKVDLMVAATTGAITPTTEVILHNGDGDGNNTDGNDANICSVGTVISGVVRAADGSVAANATVKIPYKDSNGVGKEETLTTDATGKYTFTTSSAKRVYFMAYDVLANKTINSKEYFGEQEFSIGLFDPATLVTVNVRDITLQQRNKVVVKGVDGAIIAGAKVYAHGAQTPATEFDPATDVFAIADINGEATFPNLEFKGAIESYNFYVLGGKLGTSRYFQTQTGIVPLTEIFESGGNSTETGYFYEQTIQMKSAPELAAVTIAGPGNVAGVKDGSVTLSATVGATGFPDLKDANFKMEWQSKAKDATSWSAVANSNSSSLVLSNLTEAMNGTQYRLVAYPEKAGFVPTDVIGADKVVKVANCVSQPATLSVVTGNTVDGYVYSTSGGIVAGGYTTKLPVLNIWTAANFESNQKTVYTTATIQANGALAASYDAGTSKYLPITLPDGDYVIGIKPTTGKEYTTIYSGASAFANYYGGTAKFTVAGKSITGLSLNFDPTPAVVYTQQPASKTTVVGGKTTMTVAAFDCSGATPSAVSAFQWKVIAGDNSPVNVSGATTATLTLDAVTAAMNGNKYFATATAGGKTVDSAQAVLTVGAATPIAIVKQPVSVSASVSRTAEFTVSIAGDATVTYEWQLDTGNGKFVAVSEGAQYGIKDITTDPYKGTLAGSKLTIKENTIADAWNGYKYRVVVTAGTTKLTSDAASLSVVAPTPVSIATQPVDTTAVLNRFAKFSVTAAGTAPYKFQWQVSKDKGLKFENIGDVSEYANAKVEVDKDNPALSTLTIPVTTVNVKNDMFRVIVKGSDIKTVDDNMVISNNVKITDISTNVVPATITKQPADQSVAVGRKATFGVTVDGTGPFVYAIQMYNEKDKVWSPTDATLKSAKYSDSAWKTKSDIDVDAASLDMNGYSYKIAVKDVVANSDGSLAPIIFSNAAKLTVTEVVKPTIKEQPMNQAIVVGGTTMFAVDVEGSGPFTYVWEKSSDGKLWSTVGGEAAYTTPPATAADDNTLYRVRVTNIDGDFVVSEPATLTVSSEITSASIVGEESLYIGDTVKYKIEVEPKGAYYDVEWSIAESNADKASIDKDGMLTGKANGILKVYAKVTSADNKVLTVSKKISVKKAMTSFDLKSKENRIILYKGGNGVSKYPWHTQLIPVNYKPSNASHSVKDLEWRTSDRFVATVENGKVKVASGAGTRLGTVIITATDKGNDKAVATYILQVKKAK